jgi:hypothetical protein
MDENDAAAMTKRAGKARAASMNKQAVEDELQARITAQQKALGR